MSRTATRAIACLCLIAATATEAGCAREPRAEAGASEAEPAVTGEDTMRRNRSSISTAVGGLPARTSSRATSRSRDENAAYIVGR